MRFEVTDRREERQGFLFKKTYYIARVFIHLEDEEFEALESMAKSKEWRMYPLGEIAFSPNHRNELSLETFYNWAKKKRMLERGIYQPLPEKRELDISDLKEIASTLKQVLEARLSALKMSDEDEAIEL